MEVTLALLCDAANTTAEGKLNILGTFDHISASEFPAVHPAMALVLRLSASPAEVGSSRELSIRVLDADGGQLGEITGQVNIGESLTPGAGSQCQLIFNLPNTSFPLPGRYAFHVLVSGDDKAQVPLEVVQMPLGEDETNDH